MRSMLLLAAVLALATPAAAQKMKANAPQAAPAVLAELKPGLTVKDKNGILLGEVLEVRSEPTGRQTVIIKMGENTLAVDQTSLTYDEAAAYMNATLYQLKAVLQR
jgi:hypothetical protein